SPGAMRNANLTAFADRNNGWNESLWSAFRPHGSVRRKTDPMEAKRRWCLMQGGRFQSSCAILERNLKDCVRLCEARKPRRILVGRAPIMTKQFVEDFKAAFS